MEGARGGCAARSNLRQREGPFRRRRGQPQGAWCSRRGRCQGSAGGQWNPGAAAAAEAAVSAARPRPPAPPPRGSPGGERLLLRESRLCVCVWGVPLPPCPTQAPPAPTPGFDYKTALQVEAAPPSPFPPSPVKPGVLCFLASSSV